MSAVLLALGFLVGCVGVVLFVRVFYKVAQEALDVDARIAERRAARRDRRRS